MIIERPSSIERKMKKINEVDILIGVPSYNNGQTIGHVMRAARLGLAKYFARFKSVIVNSDGGSTDDTRKAIKSSDGYSELNTILINHQFHPSLKKLKKPVEIITTYQGIPGKGSAFRTIFTIAKKLRARACILVDADLRSITPEWIQLLAGPVIYRKYDLVLPDYYRHKYDATITNSIIYPLTRALYGLRARQPIGGDFGISGKLIEHCLKRKDWTSDVCQYGIDIWITTLAIAERFKICQSFLGTKIHDPKDPKFTLGPMFREVMSTLFALLADYRNRWCRVKSSKPLITFGFWAEAAPSQTKITVSVLIDSFKKGVKKHKNFWSSFLEPENIVELCKIANLPEKYFYIPDRVWVKTIYDFTAFAYQNLTKEKVTNFDSEGGKAPLTTAIASLTDLYFGWVASYVKKTKELTTYEAEEQIEDLCIEYEKLKLYFIKKCGLD